FGGGLNMYDRKKDIFINYHEVRDAKDGLSSDVINSLCLDDGLLWIGTEDGGLNLFNLTTKQFQTFQHNPEDPATISSNSISALFKDSDGNIWIGTLDNGLSMYNPQNEKFTKFPHEIDDKFSLSHPYVNTIF